MAVCCGVFWYIHKEEPAWKGSSQGVMAFFIPFRALILINLRIGQFYGGWVHDAKPTGLSPIWHLVSEN